MKLHNRDGDTMWMMADVTELKQLNARSQFLAFHDALTGLPNRRAFNTVCQSSLDAAAREGRKAAICYLDLDGFKSANDRFGHDAGDLILKTVTERLHRCLHANDYLFRLGGDEFAVIVSSLQDVQDADAVLKQILDELRAPFTGRRHSSGGGFRQHRRCDLSG